MKVTCDFIGECPLANALKPEEADSATSSACPIHAGDQCQIREATKRRSGNPAGSRRLAPLIAAGVGGLLLLAVVGGGGLFLFNTLATPACDAKANGALMSLDPKANELEKAGRACLKRGLKRAELPAMVQAIGLLRRGAENGSAPAALSMGRLYDPLTRPDLEKQAKSPDVLPPTDPALAARFYDLAAKAGDVSARDASAALRSKFNLPAASGLQNAKADGQPLTVPGHADFYQRVLVKPGALLAGAPDAAGGRALKAFDILYVFERRPGWLHVGRELAHGAEGWIKESLAEDWQVMLVMRYAPPGQRKPALFFKDDLSAMALLTRPDPGAEVDRLLTGAQGGKPDPSLVAVEDRSVDWSSRPYVMPILKTRKTTNDEGRTVFVARVGSVASGGGATPGMAASASDPGAAAASTGAAPSYCADTSARSLRHAVVFVLDTTKSMGPYIKAVERTAAYWGDEVQRRGIADRVRFGVVAYRNNMDAEPQKSGLEYVVKVAAPLSPTSDAQALKTAVAGLSDAKISTGSIDEDAVAGLKTAVDQDWSPYCGARMIVFVTDAGALRSDNPKAHFPGVGLSTIAAQAREKGIAIYPVHLQTPEARAANDIAIAEGQYRGELGGTGADRLSTYSVIAGGTPAGFDAYLKKVGVLLDGVQTLAEGKTVAAPKIAAVEGGGAPPVEQLVMNEIFSVQQRFLGALAGAAAPTFTDSWTSDRDLSNPNLPALEVGVFLTRRQLNQLAEQTERLAKTARRAELETSRFFDLLRMVSAATSQDPARYGDNAAQLGQLLPSFLSLLPYKSDVLALSPESWRAMGAAKQDAFVRRLEEKLAFYRGLEGDQSKWRSLGDPDPNQAVAIVPLSELP